MKSEQTYGDPLESECMYGVRGLGVRTRVRMYCQGGDPDWDGAQELSRRRRTDGVQWSPGLSGERLGFSV